MKPTPPRSASSPALRRRRTPPRSASYMSLQITPERAIARILTRPASLSKISDSDHLRTSGDERAGPPEQVGHVHRIALGQPLEQRETWLDTAARCRSLLAESRSWSCWIMPGRLIRSGRCCPAPVLCRAGHQRVWLAGLVAREGASRLDLDVLPQQEAITLLRTPIGTGGRRPRRGRRTGHPVLPARRQGAKPLPGGSQIPPAGPAPLAGSPQPPSYRSTPGAYPSPARSWPATGIRCPARPTGW
jgi:hypothetical protein